MLAAQLCVKAYTCKVVSCTASMSVEMFVAEINLVREQEKAEPLK